MVRCCKHTWKLSEIPQRDLVKIPYPSYFLTANPIVTLELILNTASIFQNGTLSFYFKFEKRKKFYVKHNLGWSRSWFSEFQSQSYFRNGYSCITTITGIIFFEGEPNGDFKFDLEDNLEVTESYTTIFKIRSQFLMRIWKEQNFIRPNMTLTMTFNIIQKS